MPVLGIAIVLLLLTACGAQPARTVQRQGDVSFERLAPDVWLHTSYDNIAGVGPVRSNGLIVAGAESATLIDTAWTDEQTATVLDWARTHLRVPVSRAIFTHAHPDKMGGAGTVRQRGIASYAHRLSNDVAFSRDLVPAEFDLALDATRPGIGFDDIVVFYPGPGHTTDNIVVWHGRSRILFGGCLIRPAGAKTLGNTADAVVSEWAASVNRVAGRFPGARIVVPSHGAPAGPELLEATAELALGAGR